MAQVTMTVRTDAELKAVFVKLCEEFGMSANTAMNVFMRAVAETKSIPFTIGKSKDIEAENLMKMFEANRMANADRKEISLEEINAEISCVRAERKARLKGGM
ncbi:MAG: type II toxin-antitoxin system RelB/DinJ family antitoxin [Paludibacteraceae bacterium]|nr:type II toxin-antitoxin system RelB/DinJ family antitoxin [Paludibacteraceae bacterium]